MELEGVMCEPFGFKRTAAGDQIQPFILGNVFDPAQYLRDGRSQSDLRGEQHANRQSFCKKTMPITFKLSARDLVALVARWFSGHHSHSFCQLYAKCSLPRSECSE